MNDYFNMNNFSNGFMMPFPQENNCDNELSKKLQAQAGDNMNFNKCNFNGNASPDNLYDVYNGFIRGNMFPNLFNQYKLSRPYDIRPMNEQASLLTKVDAYAFAAHDVNLYLDTHPDDKVMIELFNQYSSDSKYATEEYEKKFGTLCVNSKQGVPWTWNDTPWPWEN